MKKKKFLRGGTNQYSKLGLRRKKKQKYRRGRGLDNKMRLNIKGHLKKIKIGYKRMKKTRGLIRELKPVIIKNLDGLKKLGKSEIGIVAKIGNKKKKEIAEYAIKNNLRLYLDPKKILGRIDEKLKKIKEEQNQRKMKKLEKDKKAQKEAEKKAKKEAKSEKKEKESIEEKLEESKIESEKTTNMSDNPKEIQTNNYGRGK